MDPGEPTPRVVRFGVFELDRRSGELRRDGVRVRLQDQPLRVLDALLAEPGEPVTREALRQRLWPDDTFVDFDNGLNRAINRLRTALGDEADNPRFIETLERRGYRFIAPVAVSDPTAAAPSPPPAVSPVPPAPAPPRRRMALAAAGVAAIAVALAVGVMARRVSSPAAETPLRALAVLPLANLTGDPAQEYFSDGMTDALITNLASLRGLRVISRQSVMRYKGSPKPLPEIARELGVDGIVEGSVARSGGRVRITAQLIHAPTDHHLWARSYERRAEDVLALQAELSRAIAQEVRLTLAAGETGRLGSERAVDPEAYDAYLLGRHQWNKRTPESLERALEHFQAAVARDPGFAPAHAGLALAYAPRLIRGYVPPGRGLAEQKAAALRALELDPGLGEAHAALAAARVQEWDWAGAEAEFRRAVESDRDTSVGRLWYGWYLGARGRYEESLVHRRRALELDPLDGVINRSVATDLAATGADEAARAQWARALELEPAHVPTLLGFALFHFERGRSREGAALFERARAAEPADPLTLAGLAVAHAAAGDEAEARRRLSQVEAASTRGYVSPVLTAYVHSALGERDRAFALLERSLAARDPLLIAIQGADVGGVVRVPEPLFAPLRADPRFAHLLRRMGLGGPG